MLVNLDLCLALILSSVNSPKYVSFNLALNAALD
jgi:hypothetical protein